MKTLTNEEALNILVDYSPEILTVDRGLRDVAISALKLGYLYAHKEAVETSLRHDIDTDPVSPSKDLAKTIHK